MFALIIIFAVGRLFYWWIGVRFDAWALTNSWQLLPQDLLRNDLVGSLWYLHSQPPLFNAVVGATLNPVAICGMTGSTDRMKSVVANMTNAIRLRTRPMKLNPAGVSALRVGRTRRACAIAAPSLSEAACWVHRTARCRDPHAFR